MASLLKLFLFCPVYLVVTLWKLCRPTGHATLPSSQLVIAYTTRVTVSPKWLAPLAMHNFRKISLKFSILLTTFLYFLLLAAASVATQERRFFGILRAGKRKDGKWTVTIESREREREILLNFVRCIRKLLSI